MKIRAAVTEAWRPLGVTLIAALAACVIFLVPELTNCLEYTRDSMARGELWRMFTCHWTHWNVEHIFWDVTAFVLLLSACLHANVKHTLMVLWFSLIAIPVCVWLFLPEIVQYRGLSGIDTALFQYIIIHTLKTRKPGASRIEVIAVYGLMAGFILKLSYELITGQTVFVKSMGENVTGVPLAHVIGAVAGCIPFMKFKR